MTKLIQKESSKLTSISSIPAIFKKVDWRYGSTNFDIGSGKYDKFTLALREVGVKNIKYDPYWLSAEENIKSLEYVITHKIDTVTVNNVLCVIKEKEIREEVIKLAAYSVKEDGTVYFQIYEKDKSGIGKKTSKGWQNNLKTSEYIPEISKYFNGIIQRGNILYAYYPVPYK